MKKIWDESQVDFTPKIEGLGKHKWDDQEVIVRNTHPELHIDYPLSKDFTFHYDTSDEVIDQEGFTLSDIMCFINDVYESIYDNPDDDYGIWGHEIGDLVLENVYYDKKTGKITLSVGS